MITSTPGWFELDKNRLLVWEGVCLLRSSSGCRLFKYSSVGILSISLSTAYLPHEVTSEGYWQCVELKGVLADGSLLYYHADCPQKAMQLLTHVLNVTDSSFVTLNIRLDDDPLRIGDKLSCRRRLSTWVSTVSSFCPRPVMTIDRDMPL